MMIKQDVCLCCSSFFLGGWGGGGGIGSLCMLWIANMHVLDRLPEDKLNAYKLADAEVSDSTANMSPLPYRSTKRSNSNLINPSEYRNFITWTKVDVQILWVFLTKVCAHWQFPSCMCDLRVLINVKICACHMIGVIYRPFCGAMQCHEYVVCWARGSRRTLSCSRGHSSYWCGIPSLPSLMRRDTLTHELIWAFTGANQWL